MSHTGSRAGKGRLTVNLATRTVEVDGRPLDLTDREYGLLEMLYRRSVMNDRESVVEVGRLKVDLRTGSVSAGGSPIELSDKEFAILELLCLNRNEIVTKAMLLHHLYGTGSYPGSKTLDVFICKLRKKIATACGGKSHIATIWGQGLILEDDENARDGSKAAETKSA